MNIERCMVYVCFGSRSSIRIHMVMLKFRTETHIEREKKHDSIFLYDFFFSSVSYCLCYCCCCCCHSIHTLYNLLLLLLFAFACSGVLVPSFRSYAQQTVYCLCIFVLVSVRFALFNFNSYVWMRVWKWARDWVKEIERLVTLLYVNEVCACVLYMCFSFILFCIRSQHCHCCSIHHYIQSLF